MVLPLFTENASDYTFKPIIVGNECYNFISNHEVYNVQILAFIFNLFLHLSVNLHTFYS